MFQPKVLKTREYFVYFPFLKLREWSKSAAVQPQPICSELPEKNMGAEAPMPYPL